MKRFFCLLLSAVILFVSACGPAKIEYLEESFFSMDTFMHLKVKDASSAIMRDTKNVIYELEKAFSKTYSESLVSLVNASVEGAKVTLSQSAAPLISLAGEVYVTTGGAYNPYLGAVITLWNNAETQEKLPEREALQTSLKYANSTSFVIEETSISRLSKSVKMDLGGIAKGYAADMAVKILRQNGINHAMLNLGGNIAVMGNSTKSNYTDAWKIGIKNPFNKSEICGTLKVTDSFISVSGAYERYFELNGEIFHHIIDPKTGYPSQSDLASVAIICPEKSKNTLPGALADALSTALFVMGKNKAIEFYNSGIYDFGVVLVTADGDVFVSENLDFEINSTAEGVGSLYTFK